MSSFFGRHVSGIPVVTGAAASIALAVFSLIGESAWRPSKLLNTLLVISFVLMLLALVATCLSRMSREPRGFSFRFGVALLIHLGLGVVSVALTVPCLTEARISWDLPPRNLRSMTTAQSLFREADKEADGNFDYGTLSELVETRLLSEAFADGTKGGFVFECTYSATTSEFLWFATARPVTPMNNPWYEAPYPGRDTYYAINHEGVTFTRTDRPFELNGSDCTIPKDATPYGR